MKFRVNPRSEGSAKMESDCVVRSAAVKFGEQPGLALPSFNWSILRDEEISGDLGFRKAKSLNNGLYPVDKNTSIKILASGVTAYQRAAPIHRVSTWSSSCNYTKSLSSGLRYRAGGLFRFSRLTWSTSRRSSQASPLEGRQERKLGCFRSLFCEAVS